MALERWHTLTGLHRGMPFPLPLPALDRCAAHAGAGGARGRAVSMLIERFWT